MHSYDPLDSVLSNFNQEAFLTNFNFPFCLASAMLVVVLALIILIATQAKRGHRKQFNRDGFHRLLDNEDFYEDDYLTSMKSSKVKSKSNGYNADGSRQKLLTEEYHDESSEDETHFMKPV